jgi:hypothetical protein
MVGGGGEQKTLRLVAQYADATNVFGGPVQIHHKYEVLRRHCEDVGRPFDEIERSTLQSLRLSGSGDGEHASTPAEYVDRFGELADAGAQHIILSVRGWTSPAASRSSAARSSSRCDPCRHESHTPGEYPAVLGLSM